MNEPLHPGGDVTGPDPRMVRKMFDAIAPRYDLLNRVLSVSTDRIWRRRAVRRLRALTLSTPRLCLDVCSGTGDLAIAIRRGLGCSVVGADFSHPMLVQTLGKAARIANPHPVLPVEADALNLPFASNHFDAVTIAFGLRNLSGLLEGLREMRRVLRPGGPLLVLEFSRPVIPGFREAFGWYFRHILPRIGTVVSGVDGPYQYLHDSVQRFPAQEELAGMFRDSGFTRVGFENLSGGIAALHWGIK